MKDILDYYLLLTVGIFAAFVIVIISVDWYIDIRRKWLREKEDANYEREQQEINRIARTRFGKKVNRNGR